MEKAFGGTDSVDYTKDSIQLVATKIVKNCFLICLQELKFLAGKGIRLKRSIFVFINFHAQRFWQLLARKKFHTALAISCAVFCTNTAKKSLFPSNTKTLRATQVPSRFTTAKAKIRCGFLFIIPKATKNIFLAASN